MSSRFALWIGFPFVVTALATSYFPTYSIRESFALTFIVLSIGRSIWNGHFESLVKLPGGCSSRKWMQEVPNSGLLRYYLIANSERILVLSAKALGEVLVSKCDDYIKPSHVKVLLESKIGKGILLTEGEHHRYQRKLLQPAFSFRHVKTLYPIFWNKGIEMANAIVKSLELSPEKPKVIRVSDWANRITLDIIGLAGMDHDFDSIHNPMNRLHMEYRKVFREPSKLTMFLQFSSLLISPRLFTHLPLKHNRKVEEGVQYIRSICKQIVLEKRQKMERKETGGVDILSIAMESGGFTNEQLVDQMMTFLAAGHETTASALQYVIYALCKHSKIQTRLREEIRSSLSSISFDSPTPIASSLIDSLPYLHAVCSETLRFYSPVPFTVREAVRDTMLLDTFIPKGTNITIAPAATNHDPDLWGPDAGIFNPERWMGPGKTNSGGATNNYAFLTFIHGPRSCIGSTFARSELACLVAVMVGRFEMELLEPEKELIIKKGGVAAPEDGVVVKLKVVENGT
ncbi:hypothetical protein AJ78_07780 [Emergomyces pasteurianus Ep9510]|uniref:Cytochrome P450 monooxygenase n=1 Tax=Emergomyces pasteurianus Ep9510 TaxID=1447872 RepID=A0A1J9Q8F0_9EURO|nr:hypothetical protein AJ78_07780 [Emergomyces pasteurianus Ep9510]